MAQSILQAYNEGFTALDCYHRIEAVISDTQVMLSNCQDNQDNRIHLYKELIRLLIISLQTLSYDLELRLSTFSDIMLNIVDQQLVLNPINKATIQKHTIRYTPKKLKEQTTETFLKLLTETINQLNNLSVEYVLDGQYKMGMHTLLRALLSRIYEIETPQCLYQLFVLDTNLSYLEYKQGHQQEAINYLNKALLCLEYLNTQNYSDNIFISFHKLKPLLMYKYNKKQEIVQWPKQIVQEEVLCLKCVCYYYYWRLTDQKELQAEFKRLEKQFYKMNPRAYKEKVLREYQNKEEVVEQNQNIMIQDEKKKQEIIEEDKELLMQKYMQSKLIGYHYSLIGIGRFKVSIFNKQKEDQIEIIIYSKPLNWMKRIVISNFELMNYINDKLGSINKVDQLEKGLKQVIEQIQIQNGQIQIQGLN